MPLHLESTSHAYQINACGPGWIEVNAVRYAHSLVIQPGRAPFRWDPDTFQELDSTHFTGLIALQPDLVLLGTGVTQRFIPPRLMQPLVAAGIPLECMGTAAACRTYTVLVAEGRHVVAALLP